MYLRSLVFIAGAAVMALEIVGSRFFAPYIGTSIVVWTSLIGMVMAGLSCGYAAGGILGDRWKSLPRLRMIVGCAGLWSLLLVVLRDPLLEALQRAFPSVVFVSIVGALLLLLVPSILLGAVSPYAVRLAASDIDHVGHTAGTLSALSTLGSIAGTFLAGFALIPHLGTTAILLTIGLTLLLTALWRSGGQAPLRASRYAGQAGVLSLAALVLAVTLLQVRELERASAAGRSGIIVSMDSPYSSIQVREVREQGTGRPFKLLQIDSGFHGAQYEEGEDHVFDYSAYYHLIDAVRPSSEMALLLGGGAYTVARDFLARHPAGRIDVVEIDPIVTQVARGYFRLTDDPRLSIEHEDARTFLNRGGPETESGSRRGSYHVVFGDTFHSNVSIPFHLTTREAAQRIAALLDERGVYLLNIITAREGRRARFLHAQLLTLRSVFPTVLAFDVNPDWRLSDQRNILLLASKTPLTNADIDPRGDAELAAMLAHRIDAEIELSDAILLTDNYAPVEAMLHL